MENNDKKAACGRLQKVLSDLLPMLLQDTAVERKVEAVADRLRRGGVFPVEAVNPGMRIIGAWTIRLNQLRGADRGLPQGVHALEIGAMSSGLVERIPTIFHAPRGNVSIWRNDILSEVKQARLLLGLSDEETARALGYVCGVWSKRLCEFRAAAEKALVRNVENPHGEANDGN